MAQVVTMFPVACGISSVITVFTRVPHWSLSWIRLIQFKNSHPKFKIQDMFPSTPRSSKFFLSFRLFHHNIEYISLPCMPNSLTSHLLRFNNSNVISGKGVIKLLIVQFSQDRCHLFPLRSKYRPQHPVHRHTQSTYCLYCEIPDIASIGNK